METNFYSCTRTGRTVSEKIMEDGNDVNFKEERFNTASLTSSYDLTSNGHEYRGESSSPPIETVDCQPTGDIFNDDKLKKRINPLKIHLGKRPFVDNSHQHFSSTKKKKLHLNNSNNISVPANPRAPKLIPKRFDHNQFHTFTTRPECSSTNYEQDKPVPRLVPKSQLPQFKKAGKGSELKKYAQSLGLQPMVKFKCRKCCSMSFKTLAMLKEHQLVCRAQAKEPALSPVAAPTPDSNAGGPSRVTRKVYLCSACGTYYENWNLFLHMREVHNRHICLFCLGMFSKAEKLSSHLTNKHNVQEYNYENKQDFFNIYNGTLYLMCCTCDEICSEQDDFFNHDCNNVKPKPVPMLVSKNSVKQNSVKLYKATNDLSTNGPIALGRDKVKPVHDKKDISVSKLETQFSHFTSDMNVGESVNSDTSLSSEHSVTTGKSLSATDSGMELESSDSKPILSPVEKEIPMAFKLNGDNHLDASDESDSPATKDTPFIKEPQIKTIESTIPAEKEGGIKLKLSLNNANSPIIINSTVDPTVGLQKAHKPPSRVRRPPKRYEKDKLSDPTITYPKTPSIKMTICDHTDSPFVRTTIYENDKETALKTHLNNNIDEPKVENAIKSTIYDNNSLEDINTLNRVPKLTVRVPKELLDKDSSSDYSSDSDVSDKLTVDENNQVDSSLHVSHTPEKGQQDSVTESEPQEMENINEDIKKELAPQNDEYPEAPSDSTTNTYYPTTDLKNEDEDHLDEKPLEPKTEEPEIPVTQLSLNKPLDKYPLKDLLKVFLTLTINNCIYCNYVRKVAVNCEQLSLHMAAQHRFAATVDSITAEELLPETIIAKLQSGASDLQSVYINLEAYDSEEKCGFVQFEHTFECFQCYFKTAIHKDLYLHNRKMHQKTILLCVMCKSNFYSYSELICHLCPGTYDSEYIVKFRCCLCSVDSISSPFRLMVHLRKIHHTCDVCLEFCHNQARLSNHVWKHKLHHLCYRCGISYRNKPDITNHLFWKHGTESVLCKRCLQKKWPHVYHFCTPPAIFPCDECNLQFSKAVYLKVHKRFHTNEFPHACSEEECLEKFVSKKLLNKHLDEHRKKLVSEVLNEGKPRIFNEVLNEADKDPIPLIDLVEDKHLKNADSFEAKTETGPESAKKSKKKKLKDKDALLMEVDLPALNLSESDSSDESDNGMSHLNEVIKKDEPLQTEFAKTDVTKIESPTIDNSNAPETITADEVKNEPNNGDKENEQQVLDIWDNFKKYQAKVEKQKEKSPPLVPIRKHVCESDHDYCIIPTDINIEDDFFNIDKKKNKKTQKKHHGGLSSSSSSSSDSDSSCSCGSNCSCSSSSGSSSSSSSDSDSSDESGNEKKKSKRSKKLSSRRNSNGSNIDVMGMSETPVLIPEKVEPPIAETDLETEESDTDEEFYDEHPQKIANKLYEEKRNQLMLLASVAPSDGGSLSGEISRPVTPTKQENEIKEETVVKSKSSKKKAKKKKKSKSSKKRSPIKINIPKEVITNLEVPAPLISNKMKISLQSNTVQIPEAPTFTTAMPISTTSSTSSTAGGNKRASKRRRVPNKFYGYSSDEENPQPTATTASLKPQLPPKLEWRKEDLPSPVPHKPKKEVPSTVITNRLYNYSDSLRLTAPIPDPEPPKILMNTESMESSDSDSSDEGNLEIYQSPNAQNAPIPPPTYLNSGTSSLPYAFQRPAVRQAREGESVYCYCRCPYDEVSEMIACDAEGCPIEWFHFECVGIMVPPKGKWYCPECRKNQSLLGYR